MPTRYNNLWEHMDRQAENRKKRDAKRYAAKREWFNALKNKPCADCGGEFPPCVMDFDHVREEKSFNIGASSTKPKEAIEAEVLKCDLVCANCHRIRTHHKKVSKHF